MSFFSRLCISRTKPKSTEYSPKVLQALNFNDKIQGLVFAQRQINAEIKKIQKEFEQHRDKAINYIIKEQFQLAQQQCLYVAKTQREMQSRNNMKKALQNQTATLKRARDAIITQQHLKKSMIPIQKINQMNQQLIQMVEQQCQINMQLQENNQKLKEFNALTDDTNQEYKNSLMQKYKAKAEAEKKKIEIQEKNVAVEIPSQKNRSTSQRMKTSANTSKINQYQIQNV